MRPGRSRVAILLAGLVGLVAGATCGDSAGSFACQSDGECETPEAIGTCEANGYCSFPDAACPSGQRYGDLAGGGFARMCVDPDLATTSATPTTTGPSSATSAVATGPAPTTSVDSTADDTGPNTTATTTGSGLDCEGMLITDDFADGMIDGMWMQVLPRYLAEGALGLELTVTADESDGYPQVRPMPVPWNVDGGFVRARVSKSPDTTGEQLFIQVFNRGGSATFGINGPDLSANYDPGFAGAVPVGFGSFDANTHRWLQLRFSGGIVFWETSVDGVIWDTFAQEQVDVGAQAVTPTITAGNYAVLAKNSVVAVDRFEMCAL